MPETRHVIKHGDKWAVKKPGSVRVSSQHRTQEAAEKRAAQILRRVGGGERVVHGEDGSVRNKQTVGGASDPVASKG